MVEVRMMLVLLVAGFFRMVMSGRENGLAKHLETTGLGKCTDFLGFCKG